MGGFRGAENNITARLVPASPIYYDYFNTNNVGPTATPPPVRVLALHSANANRFAHLSGSFLLQKLLLFLSRSRLCCARVHVYVCARVCACEIITMITYYVHASQNVCRHVRGQRLFRTF